MLTRVAVIALDQIAVFELGVLCEVFGTDRSDDGLPTYHFTICSADGRPVRSRSGFSLTPHADLGPVELADLVAVPAHPVTSAVPAAVAAARRGARRARGLPVQRRLPARRGRPARWPPVYHPLDVRG